MGLLVRIAVSLILALGIGYTSARWAISEVATAQRIKNGAWVINPNVGSSEADPYTRADVALHGFLALNKSEAIYFSTGSDNDGNPLVGNCTYTISGDPIDARWWTITAYGQDDYLIATDQNRYSVSVLELGTESTFSFQVSSNKPSGGVWLPLGDAEQFSLTLRAYNPSKDLLDKLASTTLPTIRKGVCS